MESINTTVDQQQQQTEEQEQQQIVSIPEPMSPITKLGGWEFYKTVLKSPKKVIAPMVDHTYLAFRMLCRKYGADLVYTPMFHSKNFATCKVYRKESFSTCPEDRPLVVQFCGNEAEWVVKAAKFVEDECDAIDLNLGCPQQIAKRGNYGAFLLEKPEIFLPIVRELHKNIKVPIFCKIRLLPDINDTIKLALSLQEAGCQLLTIHGRTKEQKGQHAGIANWEAIKIIREKLSIPVFANGSVVLYKDIEPCLEATGAQGVMSAEGILANPSMFSGLDLPITQIAKEYIDMCLVYHTETYICRSHLFKMLRSLFDYHVDLREKMGKIHTFEGFRDLITELEVRIESGIQPEKMLTNKQKRELKEKEREDELKRQKMDTTEIITTTTTDDKPNTTVTETPTTATTTATVST
ncbi:hypothetical protein CYY_003413 [Polysphondylium violaceum]|uniref:tRNA-dihydrouridine(16/17) synthase [NAD(P)(+)] n=1 Tax=Polysphondylium violaceum TaxID=133409 RepID=A0A8J4V8P9_9MYCE|nr:hypothetical protein CYY_003413 [Polysphondylium violaceum]